MHFIRENIFRMFVILICWAFWRPQILNAGICTTYDEATSTAHIPSMRIGEGYYWVDLKLTENVFRLTDFGEAEKTTARAEYDENTLSVHIPSTDLKTAFTY